MILDMLAASAKRRVEAAKSLVPLNSIKKKAFEIAKSGQHYCFENSLMHDGVSFICEIKKASPSKGLIAPVFEPEITAREYASAGAAAISVLTEPEYFLGSNEHLTAVKEAMTLPVLRKDFTVSEYQLYESKVIGADAVLLICAILNVDTIRKFLDICDELYMSALVEAHTAAEVETALEAGARIAGVNNRDLNTFEVDFNTCLKLRSLVPNNVLYVAESGIKSREHISLLRDAGVNAALIGETLMRSADITATLADLKKGAVK